MPKIAAKDSNKNISIAPHGTGKVVVGTGAADATVQSDGEFNLVLKTGNSTTGKIEIADGANGNIDLTPNGTGEVNISKVDIDGGAIDATDVTVGSGKTLNVSAGSLTTSTAQKQAIVDGADITTVGTVTSGTWQGTDVAVAHGGTGASTHTANEVLLGAGTGAITSAAPSTSGNVLTSNGTVWASAASAVGGKVLQVVSTPKLDTEETTSGSWVDTIDMAATLSDVATGSKVLILCDVNLGTKTADAWIGIQIYRGAVADIYIGDAGAGQVQVSAQYRGTTSDIGNVGPTFLDLSPGTGTVTYTLYWRCQPSHGGWLNRDNTNTANTSFTRCASSITLMEIGA